MMKQSSAVQDKKTESSLVPCSHEAGARITLHVAHAAKHDHRRIQVRTVDTADVMVLAVMVTLVPKVISAYQRSFNSAY